MDVVDLAETPIMVVPDVSGVLHRRSIDEAYESTSCGTQISNHTKVNMKMTSLFMTLYLFYVIRCISPLSVTSINLK